MIAIPLTQGQVAYTDDCYLERISRFKWFAQKVVKMGSVNYYAATHIADPLNSMVTVALHQLILGNIPDGMVVDHIDGNTLMCTKDNLRVASYSQNAQNCSKNKNRSSQFKGVRLHRRDNVFEARITENGATKHLGRFTSEIEAAFAYDYAAIEFYGVRAGLNFGSLSLGLYPSAKRAWARISN